MNHGTVDKPSSVQQFCKYHMVQNFDGKNIDKFDEFSAISQFSHKIFHFITTNDLSAGHYSRWQHMKHQRHDAAPRHTNSSPSPHIIITLICILKQQ